MTDVSQVVPFHSIDQLVQSAHKNWNAIDITIDSARSKVGALRIRTGQILLELRARVDAGEIGEIATWWEWYDDNFTRSRRDAERLMEIASAEDPQAAYQTAKDRNADQQRASRARKADAGAANPLIRPTTTDSQSQAKPALAPKAILRIIDEPAEPDEVVDQKEIDFLIGRFLDLSWPSRRAFAIKLRHVYRRQS